MNLQKYRMLVDDIQKLPEVGRPMLRKAKALQTRANEIDSAMADLEDDFDTLVFEIRELWEPEERHGTMF